jgi:hypothetical protein
MALRNEVRELFRDQPEKALELVRKGLKGRQRRVATLLDALLEETDRLVSLDAPKAVSVAESALALTCSGTESSPILARACSVLGTAYGAVRRCDESLRLFRRARRLPELPEEVLGAIAAREAVVSCYMLRWRRAVQRANGAVGIFERVRPARVTDFCSLPMALAVRSWVGIETYLNAPELTADLSGVMADCLRIFDDVQRNRHLKRSALVAVHNAGVVIATHAFSGRVLPAGLLSDSCASARQVQREFLNSGMTRSSVHWAKSLWLQAHLEAISSGSLTVSAERELRKGRDIMMKARATSDAIAVTLDLQWWLLEEGSLGRAVQECRFIESHLAEMGQYRPVLEAWIEGLRRREYEAALQEVFHQIRRIRAVRKPGSVKVESDTEPLGW